MGLNSVFTTNFPQILQHLGISLLVSTYQAGKLIVVRADGDQLNTNFRGFSKPMGLAADGEKVALGSTHEILEFRNLPAVVNRIEPVGKHDACYLLREAHVTGDIDIHEMAYVNDQLWFINTRFSCLCTYDRVHSFVPQWRPPFITGYDLTDRCHLNGLGLKDGKPHFITALGETDTPAGWRANKARGGILMDITTNQFICRGLSMPHSPRWYRNQLWVLESGNGSLATVDMQTGKLTTVAELPGFTRGIDFCGDLAFIGLSQVRETAVFSGIPLTQRLTDRICGVWIVNIVTGETLSFLRFTEGVQEIFAVSVLPYRYPDILESNDNILTNSFFLPDAAFRDVVQPPAVKPPARAIDAFSIIVPIHNTRKRGKGILQKTLRSIEASIDYYLEQEKPEYHCKYEIILVNDASTDGTWDSVKRFVKGKSFYRLIEHDRNYGQATARNTGAKAAMGNALFFCDDDDLYYPEHIWSALQLMNQPLAKSNTKFSLPFNFPAAVRMGVHMADPIHPHWKGQIEKVLCLNLCVRKEAHEFVEGFPEDPVFPSSKHGKEDTVYSNLLANFCTIVLSSDKTVEYVRYPGNHYDRKLHDFIKPPDEVVPENDPEEIEKLKQIEVIFQNRLQYLHQKLTRLTTDTPESIFQKGNELFKQGDLDSALQCYKRCLELNASFIQAKYNLAITLRDLERPFEAFPIFEEIVKTQPDHADAWNSLGTICGRNREWDKAIGFYEKSISVKPDNAVHHLNLGMELLRRGDFIKGWKEYEWRWQTSEFTPLNVAKPQWQGEDILDQTLMVHTEQGAGDAIQFIRYAPIVKQLCKRLVVLCPQHLYELFKLVEGIDELILPGEIPLSLFDTYIPLLSVPKILKTTPYNIPAPIPYIQPIPRPKIDEFMAQHLGKFNVGFAWTGSPTHKDNHLRSCQIIDLLPILGTPGVTFFSLQKGDRVKDLQQLPNNAKVIDLSPYLEDYLDTAWAMQKLDLIISVDTSIVHLAGAMGKPVWLMLCYVPDWRWLRLREDTPWYPTMKLFWQRKYKDWAEVVNVIQKALLKAKE